MEEECFRVGSQIVKKLLGMEDDKVQADEEIVATLTQAKEDEEEFSPQWIVEMEVMMQAYDKKKTINGDFERLSFILDGFPEGFFDTQPGDRPESSPRTEAGTSGITNLNDIDAERHVNEREQDASHQPLEMTNVDYSDEDEQSINDQFTELFNDGGAQHDPPLDKAAGNVPPTSIDGGRSRLDEANTKERVDGDGQSLNRWYIFSMLLYIISMIFSII